MRKMKLRTIGDLLKMSRLADKQEESLLEKAEEKHQDPDVQSEWPWLFVLKWIGVASSS